MNSFIDVKTNSEDKRDSFEQHVVALYCKRKLSEPQTQPISDICLSTIYVMNHRGMDISPLVDMQKVFALKMRLTKFSVIYLNI